MSSITHNNQLIRILTHHCYQKVGPTFLFLTTVAAQAAGFDVSYRQYGSSAADPAGYRKAALLCAARVYGADVTIESTTLNAQHQSLSVVISDKTNPQGKIEATPRRASVVSNSSQPYVEYIVECTPSQPTPLPLQAVRDKMIECYNDSSRINGVDRVNYAYSCLPAYKNPHQPYLFRNNDWEDERGFYIKLFKNACSTNSVGNGGSATPARKLREYEEKCFQNALQSINRYSGSMERLVYDACENIGPDSDLAARYIKSNCFQEMGPWLDYLPDTPKDPFLREQLKACQSSITRRAPELIHQCMRTTFKELGYDRKTGGEEAANLAPDTLTSITPDSKKSDNEWLRGALTSGRFQQQVQEYGWCRHESEEKAYECAITDCLERAAPTEVTSTSQSASGKLQQHLIQARTRARTRVIEKRQLSSTLSPGSKPYYEITLGCEADVPWFDYLDDQKYYSQMELYTTVKACIAKPKPNEQQIDAKPFVEDQFACIEKMHEERYKNTQQVRWLSNVARKACRYSSMVNLSKEPLPAEECKNCANQTQKPYQPSFSDQLVQIFSPYGADGRGSQRASQKCLQYLSESLKKPITSPFRWAYDLCMNFDPAPMGKDGNVDTLRENCFFSILSPGSGLLKELKSPEHIQTYKQILETSQSCYRNLRQIAPGSIRDIRAVECDRRAFQKLGLIGE